MAQYEVEGPVEEWDIGGGVNGTGRRVKVQGYYVVNPQGRRVRAFRESEGGREAAEKWAAVLNKRLNGFQPDI